MMFPRDGQIDGVTPEVRDSLVLGAFVVVPAIVGRVVGGHYRPRRRGLGTVVGAGLGAVVWAVLRRPIS